MSPNSIARTTRAGDVWTAARGCARRAAPPTPTTTVGCPTASPGVDVDRRAGGAARRAAVPDRELADLGVEEARAQQRQPHRQLGPVAVEHVVAEERVVGRIADARGRRQAALEALDPAPAGRRHRRSLELLARERQLDVQLAAAFEQCLRPQDVGAARQRAVGDPDRPPVELLGDRAGDGRLLRCRKAAIRAGSRDPVAAEVRDRRACERGQHRGVDADCGAHESELAAGRRDRAEVAAVEPGGPGHGGARRVRTAEQQLGLGLRGGRVVAAVAGGGEPVEHLGGERARRGGVAREQAQRRRVDARVVAARAREDRTVERRGTGRLAAALGSRGGQRDVLGDPRAQRGHVLLLALAEPVGVEAPGRLVRGARAREREYGSVREPDVAGVLVETSLGQVDRRQQLAAALGGADELEPLGRAARRDVRNRHASDSKG